MAEVGKAALKALVVGSGFGCLMHVPALRAAGFEVVGLVGTNQARLERKAGQYGIPACFTDLDEAIRATGANVVTIATTPATHGALALKAIAHGCHVLCEKPFAKDAAEARALLTAAEEAGIVHMVAHEFRWLPERALFGRTIADGTIGDPRFLVIDQFVPFCPDPETKLPGWWFDAASGGGWLGAGGSHMIDHIRSWLGEFESLSANLLVVSDRQAEAEDSYSVRFLLKNGMEGSMQQSAGAWGPPATMWRCAGSRGTVWLDGGKVMVADKAGTREVPVPDDLVLPVLPEEAGTGLRGLPKHAGTGPFIRMCEAMRDAIRGRAPAMAVKVPTFADGLASMDVMDAIRRSAAGRGALIHV